MEVALILVAGALTWSVCLAAGLGLAGVLRLRLERGEVFFVGALSGAALLSLGVFALAACGVLSRPSLLALGALLLACGAYAGRGVVEAPLWRALPEGRWARLGVIGWWAVLLAYLALYLGHALLPETTPDAVAYHVAYAARALDAGGFAEARTNLLAGMPQGFDMLFLFAYSIGGGSAPALTHLAFTLALPFGLLQYGRRIGCETVGRVAGLVVFVTPVVGRAGSCGYVDVGLAAIAFGVFHAAERWRETRQSAWLGLAGALAGFAFATKYTAFVAVLYVVVVVAWELHGEPRRALRAVALAGLCALLLMVPWLGKNWVQFSNPLFPFANSLFPNPLMTPRYEAEVGALMRAQGGVRLAELPLEVTLRGWRLGGLLGPLWLLALLALAALRRPDGRRVLLAGAFFVSTYAANPGTRFLLPALPFFALALGYAVSRPWWLGITLAALQGVTCWPPMVRQYADAGAWRLEWPVWRAALRLEPESQYLARQVPEYALAQALNARVGRQDRVLVLYGFPQLYARPELVTAGSSAYANRLRDVLLAPLEPELRPSRRYQLQPGLRRVSRLRIEGRSADARVAWAVAEVRVWRQGRELLRRADWRVRASSNAATATDAFDSNPLTVWSPGEVGTPLGWLEIDFGGELQLDEITLDCPAQTASAGVRVVLDGQASRAAPVEQTLEPQPRLRRAATETLKASGIGWLLVRDRDAGSADFAARTRQWGLEKAARLNGFTLYQLE